jgi:multiple sugar transport system ATP-binding protein
MVLDAVSLVFPDGTVAVDRVDLGIDDGEFVVLLGPSGCGKSSILRMIAGLRQPTGGRILLDGQPANHLPARMRNVAMVFQDFALYPHMNVRQNIGFPLEMARVEPMARARRVADVAAALGIGDLLDRKPNELSGGQRQRVAMGRAVVRRPGLLLMDEPLSNLDSVLRAGLRAEIARMARELRITTLYVTHDQTEALALADRIAVLCHGMLEDVGHPAEIYRRPATLHVAAFLGSPQMSLVKAFVQVSVDSHIDLHLGGQTIAFPWFDMRARALAHYDREDIAIGIRAEAVVPVAPGSPGPVVTGSVGHIENHGHETLMSVDIGAWAVNETSEPATTVPAPTARLRNLFMRTSTPATTLRPNAQQSRHRPRHSHLMVRLPPQVRASPGDPVTLRLLLDQLHFFDLNTNKRIGTPRIENTVRKTELSLPL